MPLISIDNFIAEEKGFTGAYFRTDIFQQIVNKYELVAARSGWHLTRHVRTVPDVLNTDPAVYVRNSDTIPRLRGGDYNLFDHFYTFKTADGRHFWATCPYANGHTIDDIRKILTDNHITPVDIIQPGFYADVTILFDPDNIRRAYKL